MRRCWRKGILGKRDMVSKDREMGQGGQVRRRKAVWADRKGEQ